MLISKAYAADDAVVPMQEAPSALQAFGMNMLLILILVVMFYVLLIMPQQKRFAQHREMLNALKKGDRVVTAGGLIGIIDTIKDGENEIVIDLGAGTKVSVLRTSIQAKPEKPAAPAMKDKK